MIAALVDAGLPPLRGSQLFSTQFDFVPVAMILAALALYLWGVRRNNALHPRHPWSIGKTVAWIGALLTTGMAIFSFVGVYDGELFWDHMVQHLLLIMVAAPLFAIASPLRARLGAPPPVPPTSSSPRRCAHGWPSSSATRPSHSCSTPCVIPVSHLTSLVQLTLEHENIHNAEHLAFLLVGYMFWRQIFGSDPNCYRLHPACSSSTCSWRSPSTRSPACRWPARPRSSSPPTSPPTGPGGPSYVTDLHVGGDIMWVVGDTLMLWPMIPVALRWMHMDERRAVRVDRELDAQALAESQA